MTSSSLLTDRLLARLPVALHAETRARWVAVEPLLVDRLDRLYGRTDGFDAWCATLVGAIGERLAARSAPLRVLDAARAAEPDWFRSQTMLGYSAYVDRFAGTLSGVAERIPHLVELGVTYLHLLPFLRARAGDNDGGFAVASYDEVDPRLGTMDDLEALTQRLRANGISLCADLVLNHVADDHPWALGARAGDAELRAFFHLFPDRTQPDRYEATLGQVFPATAPGNFSRVPETGEWVWTTFFPYQWDLDYANPQVFAAMTDALLALANRGVEAFRLDSAAFLWKRVGTDCMNQPEAHWILQALRCIVDVVAPGVLLKAEAIVPTRELWPYFGGDDAAGRECHLAYQSSVMAAAWVALAEQDTELLGRVVDATPALGPRASWLTYVRCHDDIGWKVLLEDAGGDDEAVARLARVAEFFAGRPDTFASGAVFQSQDVRAVHGTNGMAAALVGFEKAESVAELDGAQARLSLLYGLALCVGGLPVIYMGDECALGNDRSDSARRALDGRWLQRPWFDEPRHARRHDRESVGGYAYRALRRRIAQRQSLDALAAGRPLRRIALRDRTLLALARGDAFVALFNFSAEPAPARLDALKDVRDDATWIDCDTDSVVAACVMLPPWGMVWLRAEGAKR